MTVTLLATRRLTLVSLFSEPDSPTLAGLLRAPALRTASHIPVRAGDGARHRATAARIDAAIAEGERTVLLVAQGAACLTAAWWACLSPPSLVSRVAGALLIAPDSESSRSDESDVPRAALPFPSIVVGADDMSQRLAGEWGSRLIDGPLPVGHHAASGRFLAMITRFTRAIVEKDVRAAERLIAAIGDR